QALPRWLHRPPDLVPLEIEEVRAGRASSCHSNRQQFVKQRVGSARLWGGFGNDRWIGQRSLDDDSRRNYVYRLCGDAVGSQRKSKR
ncbi:hypothetical protein, partial [Agrobacterium rosae]|uniref:hypothetical protein n=1 Tax=Agrobacterium rosae TaxID=1972867 RepID=UPI003B9DD0EB